MSKHFISLDEAKKMTKKFREEKKKVVKDEYKDKDILPICETFERSAFDSLLAQPGCVSVRAYYSMDDALKIHLVVVGVNEKNEDMLPSEVSTDVMRTASGDNSVILENAYRCPSECPPSSPINN